MITLNLQQGSSEWHAERAKSFTASEAPAMLGASKYQSRNDLLKQKATGIVPEVTESQQRIFNKGHQAEAMARPLAEAIIGEELFPATGKLEDSRLLASFDGITMMEDVIWEHKLFNRTLAESVISGELPEHYAAQMEQQLLVSGAEKCLFMCSDGTEANMTHCWYTSNPELRARIISGWEQFAKDLESYEVKEEKPTVVANTPESLPALLVDIVGEVRSSNLATFKDVVLARIEAVSTDLKTDQDFADAEATVKFFAKGEKQLDEVKERALAQTSSIDELFKTVDHLKEAMRKKRLALNKLVSDQKAQRRAEIIMYAKNALANHVAKINAQLGMQIPAIKVDFAEAIKGKKTIKSLESAADDALATAMVEANQWHEKIGENLVLFNKTGGNEYSFLFRDLNEIILKDADDLITVLKSRIAEHKEAEQKRLEAEREQIRIQEEAKARAEAEAKLRAEQEAKRQAELAAERTRLAEEAAATISSSVEPELVEKPAPHFKMPEPSARPEMVTITRVEYEVLKRDSAMLHALEAAGVDSWDGYEVAAKQADKAA